jgi:nicotinamidase-related amidase
MSSHSPKSAATHAEKSAEAGAKESSRVPGDTLLICVDMQPVFIRAVAEGERVQKRCALALASAQGLGLPVLFTEQVPDKLGATEPALRNLAPNAPVFGKRTFSTLSDDAIRNHVVREAKAAHLLLCGIETSVCVYQTTVEALALGLQVTILSDAVSARRPDDARACLDELVRAGAHVLPVETVFYSLLHDVSHPFFKQYTQLVKTS